MAHLLLIDDDPALIPKQVRQAFPAPLHRVEVATSGAAGLDRLRTEAPDVILLDLRLPDQSGLEVYRLIRGIDARIPVIFITVARSADAAIEAMHQGAFDYLFKPIDLRQLQSVVSRALDVDRRVPGEGVSVEEPLEADGDDDLVGTCPAMRGVYKAIGRVAGQNVPVLITGESGTGKELVAKAIYQHGPRAGGPFLTLNCAAIPETLLESELFGHEKGAFTGADRRRIGKFEQCNGGTLFLDEIGDMPLALQAKILRLLQDQVFERLGANETVRTDVRLIAATHRDLKAMSSEGRFRSDLYYRLGVFTVHLPPLRERGEDLLLLVEHFVRRFNVELGREIREVAPEALDRLRRYTWPGNIRELQSFLKQALLESLGPVLLPTFLPADLDAISPPDAARVGEAPPRFRPGTTLSDLEREAIQQCLFQTGGNRQRTADILGISTRTLLRKIREYRLDDPLRQSAPAGDDRAFEA
jgi:two-component system nitrogen regulation response regulator GlnG